MAAWKHCLKLAGKPKSSSLAPGAETDALIGSFERIAAELAWQPVDQLRAYQGVALHLAVRVGEELAGGLQVVLGSGEADLPYRRVWPEAGAAGASAAHVTILALEKPYRGHPGLFGPLCVELWRHCDAGNIGQIVIEATPVTLRLYRRLGWPLKVIGDLRLHWGEECYLCAMGSAGGRRRPRWQGRTCLLVPPSGGPGASRAGRRPLIDEHRTAWDDRLGFRPATCTSDERPLRH